MTFIQQPPRDGKPRAIETVWKGYRFRSRLEARWAVFFETLGLSWEYEPEGFDLDDVWYLPDFRVKTPQGADIWYEIKPKGVETDEKFERFKLAVTDVDERVRAEILAGDPVDVLAHADICPRCGFLDVWHGSDPRAENRWPGYDRRETLHAKHAGQRLCAAVHAVACYPCDVETPSGGENDDEPGFLGALVRPDKGVIFVDAKTWRQLREHMVDKAAAIARQARFEHGEQP